MKISSIHAIGLLLLLVVGGLSFWGGMKYRESHPLKTSLSSNAVLPPPDLSTTSASGSAPMKFGSVFGPIVAISNDKITVKSFDGKMHDIAVTATTSVQVTRVTNESPSTLKVGDSISASGPLDDAGVITAQTLQKSNTTPPPLPAGLAPKIASSSSPKIP